MINMENRDYDMTMTPILSKYQYQKPKDFGDYTERCYPVSAVMDMLKQYSLEQNKQLLDEIDMLKFQLKAADSINQWISVEDRLPLKDKQNDIECLCYDNYHKQIRVLSFNVYHNCWDDESGDDYYTDAKGGKITHWMPLPNQPKKT